MKIVFRVDSSIRMGGGHLMRCLSLAEILVENGIQISFICREHPGNLIAYLRSKLMLVAVLPYTQPNIKLFGNEYGSNLGVTQVDDALQTIEALNGEIPDYIIIDHYDLDIAWEKKMRPYTKRLMVIDDLANRHHDCDILLDQNYSFDDLDRYRGLVPSLCKVLLGQNYALLRKEFLLLQNNQKNKKIQLNQILVFFTVGDDQGETLKAMHGIALFDSSINVDVVVGSENPDNNSISEMCANLGWGYHCQVDYMPKLISEADLVIGAGGSSNWERCALGVPALVVILAENQAAVAQGLDRAGVVVNLGWNIKIEPKDYAEALNFMTTDLLRSMSKKAFQLVDARGAERVAKVLIDN